MHGVLPARSRGRSERGAAMVEAALVFLPFMAMMMAIVDFSMPIFLRSTFSHAVREGVRFGITHQSTYNSASYASQTAAIQAVVQGNAMGFLAGASGLTLIQVKYYAASSPFGQVTGAGANAGGNIVEVAVSGFNWGWIVPIWRTNTPLAVGAISADRLEPMASGTSLPTP